MSIQGIRAGKAFVEFFIDDKGINSGLAKISKSFSEWGRAGLKYSLPVVGAFGAAAASFANAGSELYDMSRRTGVSVEQLSMLKYAADQSGVEFGTLEKAFKTLEKNGINPEKFGEVAAEIAKIPDQSARVQAALNIFGKAGYDIVPLLQDLPELNAQFQKLGITMSTQDAVAADALGDAFAASKAQFWGLVNVIGESMAGPLTELLQWTQGIVAEVINWAHENPFLAETIAVVGLAVAGVSAATAAFGLVLSVISAHPIIAFLTLVAALVVGIAHAFGWASSGAKEFEKKLDATIQKANEANLQQLSADSAKQIKSLSAVGSPQFAAGRVISPQAAGFAATTASTIANADSAAIVKLLANIATSNTGILTAITMRNGGLMAVAL